MSSIDAVPQPRPRTPVGPTRPGQPWWNPQRGSSMPVQRYARTDPGPVRLPSTRTWVDRSIDTAPLWASVDLRDGNQSLAEPMDPRRKGVMFDLLVSLGFKEIEVAYPSASEADFAFVRELVTGGRIPADVTISVFTPAKEDLIERTFDAVRGAQRAVVHLCMATACLWRDVVFGLSRDELRELTVRSAEQVARLAAGMRGSSVRFEYTPETFNVTEPDFALEICDAVTATWDASPDRPVTVNLPSTVETESPNVYADQVEWMHRNLARREALILSVHPHNDRGTAVAAAELALMAGADRVEGTLFGNGERTGNVCVPTLALNLASRGVDPQLDFSDIDGVRRTVEFCNRMPVGARHPYVGDLVYTAFSGTHQDAIGKGMVALEEQARATGRPAAELPWAVPYLPMDPRDVGRSYLSVVRVNSQSGKGGVAHILRTGYGLDLPRALRVEVGRLVQRVTDETGAELEPSRLWEVFAGEYLDPPGQLAVKDRREDRDGDEVTAQVSLVLPGGGQVQTTGAGADGVTAVLAAVVAGLRHAGHATELRALSQHLVATGPAGVRTASYAELAVDGAVGHGVGLDASPSTSALGSVLSAANRLLAAEEGSRGWR